MPRFVSFVMALAADGSERGPTHTFNTPSFGAMKDTYLPSGDRRACVFSGLPNKAVRGITGTPATDSAAVGACATAWAKMRGNDAAAAASNSFFMGAPRA
jgi:hypothetical protein